MSSWARTRRRWPPGLSLLCAGSKSSKLAVAWELLLMGTNGTGLCHVAGFGATSDSFLATLLAVASLPDGAAGDAAVAECAVDVADDADDAAVALAAAVFADAGGDDLSRGLRRLRGLVHGRRLQSGVLAGTPGSRPHSKWVL